MSLYSDYIKDRLGDDIIEDQNGFLSYRFITWDGQKAVYLIDLYVVPSERKTRLATKLADQVLEIARKKGCTLAIGSVALTANHAEENMTVLKAYGMSLLAAFPDYVLFSKTI